MKRPAAFRLRKKGAGSTYYNVMRRSAPRKVAILCPNSIPWVSLCIDGIDWMARQLARVSFEFEIRSPAELGKSLRAHGQRLTRVP